MSNNIIIVGAGTGKTGRMVANRLAAKAHNNIVLSDSILLKEERPKPEPLTFKSIL